MGDRPTRWLRRIPVGEDMGSAWYGPWRLRGTRWERPAFSWSGRWQGRIFCGGSWTGLIYGPHVSADDATRSGSQEHTH